MQHIAIMHACIKHANRTLNLYDIQHVACKQIAGCVLDVFLCHYLINQYTDHSIRIVYEFLNLVKHLLNKFATLCMDTCASAEELL